MTKIKPMIAWGVLAGLAGASTLGAQSPAPPQPVSGIDITAFDKSVRWQDDFFRYVNGAWIDKTPIPAARGQGGESARPYISVIRPRRSRTWLVTWSQV